MGKMDGERVGPSLLKTRKQESAIPIEGECTSDSYERDAPLAWDLQLAHLLNFAGLIPYVQQCKVRDHRTAGPGNKIK